MSHRSKQPERKLLHRLGKYPDATATLLVLARHYREKCERKWRPLLENAVATHPHCQDARTWFEYGRSLEHENRGISRAFGWYSDHSRDVQSSALCAYRRATELDPGHAQAWAAYARCMTYRLPQPHVLETIERAWRKAIEADPDGGQYHHALGKLLAYGPCRPEEAAALYERGLRLSPRDPQIGWQWYELACLYHEKLRRFDDAERSVLVALELQPEVRAYSELLDTIRLARAGGSSGA